MLPKPKSEAWLICGLQDALSYNCEQLEERSGNDASPNSLKGELRRLIGDVDLPTLFAEAFSEGRIDTDRIAMPSFAAFRTRLEEVI